MALPTVTNANASGGDGSAKGTWVQAWANANTAASSAELYAPLSMTGKVTPIKLGANVTRLLIRGRIPGTTSAVATSPVVWVYGVWPSSGAPDSIDSGIIARVDNADQDATGLTLTFQASPTASNSPTQTIDGVEYHYSDIVSLDGTDMKGATWALVVVATAASTTDSGSGVADVQVLAVD